MNGRVCVLAAALAAALLLTPLAASALVDCWRHDRSSETMVYDCPEPAPDADRDLMGRPPEDYAILEHSVQEWVREQAKDIPERIRQIHATEPGFVPQDQRNCLMRESLRGNAEAIGVCRIPRDLYSNAIAFVGELNASGYRVSTAFLRKYCEKSMDVGVSFTCTYGDVTIEWYSQ